MKKGSFLKAGSAAVALSLGSAAVGQETRVPVVRIAEPGIDPARLESYRAEPPPACPAQPVRVVRSAGDTVDYLGSVPGIPELCRLRRTADGEGDFYLGIWRSDWPGAGQAYPAIRTAIHGPPGTRTSFVTRSFPGMQWIDSYTNEGVETLVVGGIARQALRLAHEREGIEGNTYHSVITQWKDLGTGVVLKTVEHHISGQSYGSGTTWDAVRIEVLPRAG